MMSLLDRIAASNGDPERTIQALRLINENLKRKLGKRQLHPDAYGLVSKPANQIDDWQSPPAAHPSRR